MIALKIGSIVFLVVASAAQAQVASVPPKDGTQMTPIYGFPRGGFERLNLANNTPEEIRKELLDTNTLRLIAKFNGLSARDLATVQIGQENGEVQVYQVGNTDKAFKTMSEQLRIYADARDEGHTRNFCMAALTNRTDLSSVTDPYLRAFLKNQPMLPADRLTNIASGAYTNKAGIVVGETTSTTILNGKMVVTTNSTKIPKVDEVGRWIEYVLVD